MLSTSEMQQARSLDSSEVASGKFVVALRVLPPPYGDRHARQLVCDLSDDIASRSGGARSVENDFDSIQERAGARELDPHGAVRKARSRFDAHRSARTRAGWNRHGRPLSTRDRSSPSSSRPKSTIDAIVVFCGVPAPEPLHRIHEEAPKHAAFALCRSCGGTLPRALRSVFHRPRTLEALRQHNPFGRVRYGFSRAAEVCLLSENLVGRRWARIRAHLGWPALGPTSMASVRARESDGFTTPPSAVWVGACASRRSAR